ncbi:tyrosine-type recombinase/integrase [Formosa sp. A9]|uniref:tyrosine-type recombinase/integrase n=1 Tax=Formosa sp. A9 TaxID=3442641 RepID=UPI003EBD9828
MSSIFLLLRTVYDNVYDLPMKIDYSEPKIYTGGVDINHWSKLTKKEKDSALKKNWYVYYAFRNPKTGKLQRQPYIKGGANLYKDRKSRLHILKVIQTSLLIILEEGFNPYTDNTSLKEYLLKRSKRKGEISDPTPKVSTVQATTQSSTPIHIEEDNEQNTITIEEAFKLALELKERMMSSDSFTKYKSRINRFRKWLLTKDITSKNDISCITKKIVIQHLNDVLQSSSPRNRNNTRTDLASLFQLLEDNDIIPSNFIQKINVLKAVPERNKTYKPHEQKDIFEYLKKNDPVLFLFVQFISYNFLRPIEVCRVKIGDIDLKDKKIYIRAKNQPVKIKIIPDILINQLPDLSHCSKDDFLFTESQIGGSWDTKESNKRDLYTKKFKKVKDHFGLDSNYGLYSFRHTFITKVYREMAKTATPFEVKSRLQLITGHATMNALEQYLRDIDAALPDDYSKLLQ